MPIFSICACSFFCQAFNPNKVARGASHLRCSDEFAGRLGESPLDCVTDSCLPYLSTPMTLALNARLPVFALLAAGSLIASCPAQAEFIYARLVPAPGVQSNGASGAVDVSSEGRTVVFTSEANNWIAGDTYNGNRAIAVDLATGVIDIVSKTQAGVVIRGEQPAASGNGRYVAFLTYGSPLGVNWQVGRKDRVTGELALVSATASGVAAVSGTDDDTVSISADGRFVAFESASTNLGVPSGSSPEVFVKDMQTGAVTMASVKSDGSPSGGTCTLEPHALSDDGRYITFVCTNDPTGGAGYGQLYLRDLQANTTTPISRVGAAGAYSSAIVYRPAISPDGRFVSFQNRGYGGLGYAGGTVDSNSGVYLRDRQTQTTIAIPRPAAISSNSYDSCSVSAVSNLATVLMSCGMTVGPSSIPQVFLFIPGEGAPDILTVSGTNQPGNAASGNSLAVNRSGLSMAFASQASNLDPDDTNGFSDIFVLVDSSLLEDVIFTNGFEQVPSALHRAHLAKIPKSN